MLKIPTVGRRGFRRKATCVLAVVFMSLCVWVGLPATAAFHEGRLTASLRAGVFLFAVPELHDSNFVHTVVLLVDYSKEGAMGLIINRSTDTPVDQALPDVKGLQGLPLMLYWGGPVSRERILILLRSEKPPEGARSVFDDIYVTWSHDALVETLKKQDPDRTLRVYSGFAGWGPGQLDREVGRGDWIISKADSEKVFTKDPSKIWPEVFTLQKQIEVFIPTRGSLPS